MVSDESGWVNCMLNAMTMPEKVGQLFVLNAYGTSATDTTPANVQANQELYGPSISTIQDLISAYHPGGLIYFTWANDLSDPNQVVGLSNGVQQAALAQDVPSPLLISTDQEEGWILRIGSPATVFPGNMAVGATRNLGLANQNSAITGQELRAMGINVDNAPVVDVNTNQLNPSDGVRAFGDQPGFVSDFATASVQGFQGPAGVAAVAKHWPGLGDTSTNPDTGITTSNQTLAQLESTNFPSFEAAIGAGVDQIMVTHILFPNIDSSGVPSSLSPYFVTTLLRNTLGYNGLVVTDAMNAQALSKYTPAQAAVMAVQAGDDELLYAQQEDPTSPQPAQSVAGYQAVLNAVNTNQISSARINQSVVRILTAKWKDGLASNPFTDPNNVFNVVGTPAHQAVAQTTAEASITVLKNDAGLLPLKTSSGTKVLVTGYGSSGLPEIGQDLSARGLTPQVMPTGFDPTDAQITQAVAAAKQNQLVIVDTFNAWEADAQSKLQQVALVNALLASGTPVIVDAVGTPYDVAYMQGAPTFVTTYDPQTVSLDAMVAVIFGEVPATGKLPVTITQPPPSTQVLYPFGYGLSLSGPASGYWEGASDGGIFAFGDAGFFGSMGGRPLNKPIVGVAATPDAKGYWEAASDGGIFAFGDAAFYGSTGSLTLNKPIVGMAATPDGHGYWLVGSDGGIFAFGDAGFYGSTGSLTLNKPIVGMAGTPDGRGYWLVASDGGIFAFGDASFFGSTGALHLNQPIVGMAGTPDGRGYWLVASDGGIFNFGDAAFFGSTGAITLNKPIVGMAGTPDGQGYWLVASDGGIFNFGDAGFFGSMGGQPLNKPIVGMAVG